MRLSVSKLLWIIGQIFAVDREHLFSPLIRGKPLNLLVQNFVVNKLETSLYRRSEMYFATLNRLGVDHECDERTDRQTDKQIEWPLAIAQPTVVRCANSFLIKTQNAINVCGSIRRTDYKHPEIYGPSQFAKLSL